MDKIEKIVCGLGHSGCIINGRAYVWGICGTKESMIFKIPTSIEFMDSPQSGVSN
jgi:mitogen-activated protein kinase kinase kinase 9